MNGRIFVYFVVLLVWHCRNSHLGHNRKFQSNPELCNQYVKLHAGQLDGYIWVRKGPYLSTRYYICYNKIGHSEPKRPLASIRCKLIFIFYKCMLEYLFRFDQSNVFAMSWYVRIDMHIGANTMYVGRYTVYT